MDIKQAANKRIEGYEAYNIVAENPPYNYAKEGILSKSLPKILFKGNAILVTFIQLIDVRLIMLFKYIDKVKRFKWISWY